MIIILRAVCFSGVSMAYPSKLSPLSGEWQSMQFMPVAAEKNPIVSRNSFTEIPLSNWTFLKTSSAINGFCSAFLRGFRAGRLAVCCRNPK